MSPPIRALLAITLLTGLAVGTAPLRREEDEAFPPLPVRAPPPGATPTIPEPQQDPVEIRLVSAGPIRPAPQRRRSHRPLSGEPFVEPPAVKTHKGPRRLSRAQRRAAR